MIDCSSIRVSRKLARRFRSVQAIFSAHKKAHKTLDLGLSMTYGVVRTFQVIVNTLLCSEKRAGVGGSTPSLATHISKQLTESRLALPFRSQSASVCGVAENRSQHCPCRSHAILADTVGITLQGRLNITVAKQPRSPAIAKASGL